MSDYTRYNICVGKGWAKLVESLVLLCDNEGVEILQVKEKFGGLRFYTDSCTDAINTAIDIAEIASTHTCETCGEPGKIIDYDGWFNGWFKCCCEKHR